MKKLYKYLLVFIFITPLLKSCTGLKKIEKTTILNQLINDSLLQSAFVGVAVYNPNTNDYLLKYNSNKLFVPASNAKIITCYTALKKLTDSLLSIQYYETDTSIHVLGVGNPINLHQDFLHQPTINFLKNHSKKIYLHNNYFEADALGYGWSWDDYEATYMAERSFLPLYGNILTISKDSTNYKTTPPQFLQNTTQNNSNLKGFDVSRKIGTNNFTVTNGKNNSPKQITISTQNTSAIEALQFSCNLLSEALNKPVYAGKIFNIPLAKKQYNAAIDSVLKQMMHESDNFFAEQLLLMSSYESLGVLNEKKIIDTILKLELKELPQKPKWVDGSGLSRYNLFSPEDFVFILNKMKIEFGFDRIKTIFATGNEGTLRGYYKNYQHNIFAKTGTLSNHVALSGFITTKKNEELIFSVLVNNHTTSSTNVRRSVEKLISSIIENY